MALSTTTRAVVGLLVVAAVITAGLLVSPGAAAATLESVATDPWLFGLLVAGLYLVRPLFAWPTTPLAIVVGYGYGITLGVVVATLGVLVTVTPVYLLARRFFEAGGHHSSRGLEGLLERAGTALRRYYATAGPLRGVIASRLAPIPSDVATCAAAASGVRLRHLLVGTAVGELPWTVAAVVVGASAATLTTEGLGELGFLVTGVCLVAAGVLLAGPAYRVVQSRRAGHAATSQGSSSEESTDRV